MEKLDSVQRSTAFAVTDAWKGTSREKLYNELGWKSLPYNLAYRSRSYKGAGAYIRIKEPWRLYPAQFFEYRISYRILTKK